MTGELQVELYGTTIAELRRGRTGIILRYTSEARDRWGDGSVILSCSMPIGPAECDASAFVGNLLPEGEAARVAIGNVHGVDGLDSFAMIGAIGMDCAGAARIGPPEAFAREFSPKVQAVTTSELADLIRSLPRRPFGMTRDMRLSLGGNQRKILLVKLGSEQWGIPINGAASTHIIKPEPLDLPYGYAANEAYCMTLARACELTTVDASVINVGGRSVYSVSRYDRIVESGGSISRIHQEDFCQAAGRSGVLKYEARGQRRLVEAATVVRRWTSARWLERLMWHVVFHLVIGNTDAHDKNFSLLHAVDGTLELAPMYDASSTVWKVSSNRDLASSINGIYDLDSVTFGDLVAEAAAWRLRGGPRIITQALERIHSELALLTFDATVDEEMVELMTQRCAKLLNQYKG
jgi:serine/threonine-protein kinase HipA